MSSVIIRHGSLVIYHSQVLSRRYSFVRIHSSVVGRRYPLAIIYPLLIIPFIVSQPSVSTRRYPLVTIHSYLPSSLFSRWYSIAMAICRSSVVGTDSSLFTRHHHSAFSVVGARSLVLIRHQYPGVSVPCWWYSFVDIHSSSPVVVIAQSPVTIPR